MKKIVALLIAISMLLTFVACSSEKTDDEKDDAPQKDILSEEDLDSTNGQPTSEADVLENPTSADAEAVEPSEELTSAEVVDGAMEATAIDNDRCSIKIVDIYNDDIWGFTVKVELENKSDFDTYTFSLESSSINGVKCSAILYEDVAAGKKSINEINYYGTLDDYDIGIYTDIELSFRVHIADDYSSDDIVNDTIHAYPFGAANATQYVREDQPGDNVLIDNEYVKVIVIGYEYDDIWGYSANLFLINKTDRKLRFAADEVSLNGYMLDPYFIINLDGGKCAYEAMTWYDSNLEESGITEVEEIEFIFSVRDADDWYSDDLVNEAFTLNP